MKNAISLFTVVFLFVITFSSCKKDIVTKTVTDTITNTDTVKIIQKDTVAAAPSVIGFWAGGSAQASPPIEYPNQEFSFLFRNDNTVRVYIAGTNVTDTSSASSNTAEGTYSISGQTITISFTYFGSYIGVAVLNNSLTFMQGTVGIAPSTTGELDFIAAKQ